MRDKLKDKKRIVFKVGTSTLTHAETGALDLVKMEKFVRILTDLHNQGKEVVVVSSGAIAVGRRALRLEERPKERSVKQACAAVGQSRLMMVYQKLFSEYNQNTAQVLNENDTVATDEIDFGDNDSLSAVVSAIVGADLLVLLSDIDGLFTDDPNKNKEAKRIPLVNQITDEMLEMAKGPSTDLGTGGMSSKLGAAGIANDAGADMIIINGNDMDNINRVFAGEEIGTLFTAHKTRHFHLKNYLEQTN